MKPTNMLRVWAKKFMDICDQHCNTGLPWQKKKGNSRITSEWPLNSKECKNGKRYSISQQSQGPFHAEAAQGQGEYAKASVSYVTTSVLGMYVNMPCPSAVKQKAPLVSLNWTRTEFKNETFNTCFLKPPTSQIQRNIQVTRNLPFQTWQKDLPTIHSKHSWGPLLPLDLKFRA